jgi:hypothetical protein
MFTLYLFAVLAAMIAAGGAGLVLQPTFRR